MRALRLLLPTVALIAVAVLAPAAKGAFGLKNLDANFTASDGSAVTQAGSHPFAFTTNIEVNTVPATPEGELPDEEAKDIKIDLPPGLVGTPTPVPPCPAIQFVRMPQDPLTCPAESVIGVASIYGGFGPKLPGTDEVESRVVNLEPAPGSASKIGFVLLSELVTVETRVSPDPPYHLVTDITNIPDVAQFYSARVTLWGVPADPAHDDERFQCAKSVCPVDLPEIPFLTMPRSCTGPLQTVFKADSWQNPGIWTDPIVVESHNNSVPPQPVGLEGCSDLDFSPEIDAEPTNAAAGSATGLNFDLLVDDPELTEPNGIADSDIKKAVVTLPAGVTTNPSVAAGLQACSLAQYKAEKPQPGEGCPQESKVGSIDVETPLLPDTVLHGSLYVAKQHDNPFDNLLTIYMVINDPKLGIVIRQAGRVEPDPSTGQLKTTFDDLPEIPFSRFHLHFNEGERAPLITPPTCGSFKVDALLYPHADPGNPLSEEATFTVSSGANGSPCTSNESDLPNAPELTAGTLTPVAGAFSPLIFKVSREDGSQQISSVSAAMPEGLTGKLAGIPYCSEEQISTAMARSGEGQAAAELASPSCPAATEVGSVVVAAGAGSEPLHVTGHAYLAGPYKGAPLSFVIVTPAVAGPFDLGTVTVRTPLYVDQTTAEIKAVSDPIPTILHGLPLVVRSVTLKLDRPSFTMNPTSCEPKSIVGSAASTLGSVAPLSEYFQVRKCRDLGFKPRLSLRLKGATKRTGHPSLRAVLTNPGGKMANLARAIVTLPPTQFIDPTRINNPCTRVQFDAGACPSSSILGRARAFTPLLDQPLEGPIYFRSNGGDRLLPDMVADFRGQIRAVAVGFIDSVKKKGAGSSRLRTTFAHIPDVPLTKVSIRLFGGKKGILVNSRNICKVPQILSAKFLGHNGRKKEGTQKILVPCSKKKKPKR